MKEKTIDKKYYDESQGNKFDMKLTHEELVEALEGMALQYLSDVDGNIMTYDFMVAGENCLDVPCRLGKVKSDDEINYTFVKKNP